MDAKRAGPSGEDVSRKHRARLHAVVFLFPVLHFAGNVFLYVVAEPFYRKVFLGEDAVLETTQASAFFLSGVLSASVALRWGRQRGRTLALWWGGLACMLLFAAMEEISWGQRYLGFETPPQILEHNRQREMTVHNLEFVQPHLGWLLAVLSSTLAIAWALPRRANEPRDGGGLRHVLPGPVCALYFASFPAFHLALAFQNRVLGAGPLHVWQQELFETPFALGFLVFAFEHWLGFRKTNARFR